MSERCRRHALTYCEECHGAARVTRVEVIDHRADTDTFGRAFVAWNAAVTLSYQDGGRTLKVFVDDPARVPVEGPRDE